MAKADPAKEQELGKRKRRGRQRFWLGKCTETSSDGHLTVHWPEGSTEFGTYSLLCSARETPLQPATDRIHSATVLFSFSHSMGEDQQSLKIPATDRQGIQDALTACCRPELAE